MILLHELLSERRSGSGAFMDWVIRRVAVLVLLLVLFRVQRNNLVLLILHKLDHGEGVAVAEVQVLFKSVEVALTKEGSLAVRVCHVPSLQPAVVEGLISARRCRNCVLDRIVVEHISREHRFEAPGQLPVALLYLLVKPEEAAEVGVVVHGIGLLLLAKAV